MPYSPLGHDLRTGRIRTVDDFSDDDWRKIKQRFTGDNARRNPAQTAPAWLLTCGDDIAPIPGTRRVARVEENSAADGIALTPAQLERLNNLTPLRASVTTRRTWPPSTAEPCRTNRARRRIAPGRRRPPSQCRAGGAFASFRVEKPRADDVRGISRA